MSKPIRIGLLRLVDSAPVIVARAKGLFRDQGIDVEISIEPSWTNIADKQTYGILDAAVMLPPLALAACAGMRGAESTPGGADVSQPGRQCHCRWHPDRRKPGIAASDSPARMVAQPDRSAALCRGSCLLHTQSPATILAGIRWRRSGSPA